MDLCANEDVGSVGSWLVAGIVDPPVTDDVCITAVVDGALNEIFSLLASLLLWYSKSPKIKLDVKIL